ncbi:MAG: 50S ribosomal protein L6 [Phycisphaerales bacterium]|nr:50S ribosomal protein L6 [Phycisphaerales bacterium]
MSRVGNKPVELPAGVKAELAGRTIKLTGPKGTASWTAPSPIDVKVEGNTVKVARPNDDPANRALHGTTRALINNMAKGVKDGYSIGLEIYGTGYTCKLEGKKLMLNVGFMGRGVGKPAQFVIPIPAGVDVKVDVPAARGNNEPAKFTVSGVDKQAVGDFAAAVRKLRKPEPYQGKGIRYAGEQIRRKAGKVFAGGG